jgi:hypothetical protein
MQKLRTVTFFFTFLFSLFLTASITVGFISDHRMQKSVSSTYTMVSLDVTSAMHTDQKAANEPHQHSCDGHNCCNCIGNVIFPLQTIKLDYNPADISFSSFKPVTYLPEVTLSRFIPPRTLA